jgi:hypothetical protein
MPTRCRSLIVAAVTVAVASPTHARAQALFYGGDVDPGHAHTSGINLTLAHAPNQLVFDNFVVGALPWQVTSVFANMLIDVTPTPSTLLWEIRTGMVPGGSVGTVVAGGSGAYSLNGTTYTIPVTPLTLGPGTYWLAIYGDAANVTNGFSLGVEGTAGANAINAPGDDSAIWLIGADVNNVGGSTEAITRDFSYGVNGTVLRGTTAPEPATWTLIGAGLLALGLACRHRES